MTAATARQTRLEVTGPWISTLARLALAGIFLFAGIAKAIDPSGSVAAVRAYQLLPQALATPIGWGLPFVEIGVGLLLALGLHTRPAAALAAILLLVVIAAVISVAARGLSINCGCFGGGGPVPPGQTQYTLEIARDVGLVVLAGWLVWRPRSRWCLERWEGEAGDE